MGLVLWYLRKNVLCLNHREVAAILGEVHTTIGSYELGRTKVTIKYLESFCDAFNIDIDKLWSMYMLVRNSDYQTSRNSVDFLRSFDREKYLEFVSLSLNAVVA